MKKKKVIKRKISKIKKKNPKEPYYMRSVDLSGREENEGIDQLNIDMGDMHSITEDDFLNLKRNYYECPNNFLNKKFNNDQFLKQPFKYRQLLAIKYGPLDHIISYCKDSSCKECAYFRVRSKIK